MIKKSNTPHRALNSKMLSDIDKLDAAIKKLDVERNNVKLSKFKKYTILFNEAAKSLPIEQIKNLSREMMTEFNLYRPIYVFDDATGEKLFTVPRLFVELVEIDNKYEKHVASFRSNASSDVPRYSANACSGLTQAIINSQIIDKGSDPKLYGQYIMSLAAEYQQHIKEFEEAKKRDLSNEITNTDSVDSESQTINGGVLDDEDFSWE